MIKVGIFGFGTIGKRVADAVMLQDDMELVGVSVHSYNQRIMTAEKKGFKLYKTESSSADVQADGTVQDLFAACDVIVDGTPGKMGAENMKLYKAAGVKAILQGGEKAETVECSFNASCNFEEARGKDYVRVVSCNTTALSRVLGSLKEKIKMGHVAVTLMRRSLDPGQKGKTVMNALMPTFEFPSHHGPDVNTIMPDIDISTVAFKLPTTLMHAHSLQIELTEAVTTEAVLDILKNTDRVHVLPKGAGVDSTAHVMELGKDLGQMRGDFMEAAVWEEGVNVSGHTLYITMAVHQESIVVPDNIDCIRAMCSDTSKEESITKTNKTLGL
ncbi:MAG: type II glyceraldehyde-3-phosphate dehydrogenase [Candidatus Woesearchaeota archaeon]|nr:type II glyceraldehyde-3-phosphate dehydrogenase [Candidatus Woesearchaeota archaeon]